MSGFFAALILGLLAAAGCARAEALALAPFSAATPGGPPPPPWKLQTLPKIERHTRYALVRDEGRVVLRADAQASMASLAHPLRLDAAAFPILEWQWKITSLIRGADLASKEGDDFPARIYVLFDYDIRKLPFATRTKFRIARALYGADLPLAALCYVWDGKAPRDTAVWSAYTDRVRVIVAESGPANLNRWMTFRRNIREDFRAAFGEDPPPVTGVVIATDTDNTGASVTAFYGDIRFTQ